jgi:hypothetical protein
VPAKVGGTWKFSQGELALTQNFQVISGTLISGSHTVPITDGKLTGDLITFRAGDANYSGRVRGSTIQGTIESGGSTTEWTAAQVHKAFRTPSEPQDILGLLIQAEVTT